MVTSGGEGPDSVKVIRDGILIEKSLEGAGQSPVPRVRFDLVSKRDETVDVRFVDTLPDTLTSEQVVFDPEDETEHVVGGPQSITFEARLQPGREYVTHYTVHEPPNGLDDLLRAPQLKSVETIDEGLSPNHEKADRPDGSDEPSQPTDSPREEEDGTALASLKGLLTPTVDRGGESVATGQPTLTEEADRDIDRGGVPDEIPAARTASNGITLVRTLTVEAGGLLASIEVASTDRETPVTVLVADRLPERIEHTDIEFHPSFRPDSGRVSDDGVAFRISLSPDERREISYGIIPLGPLESTGLRQFQTRLLPQFEVLDEPSDKLSIPEPGLTLTELFGEEAGTREVMAGDDLIDRIVQAIEAEEVDEAAIQTIRNRLGVGQVPGSLDARLSHLESRTAEFSAYADTIQQFLDQHGPAAEAFADLNEDIKALRADLKGFEEKRSAIRHRLDRLATDLEQVDEASATRVRRVRDQLDSLESVHGQDISRVESSLDEVQADLAALEDEVQAEQERWSALSEAFE